MQITEGDRVSSLCLDYYSLVPKQTTRKYTIIDSWNVEFSNETMKEYIKLKCLCNNGHMITGYFFDKFERTSSELRETLNDLKGNLVVIDFEAKELGNLMILSITGISEVKEQSEELINRFYRVIPNILEEKRYLLDIIEPINSVSLQKLMSKDLVTVFCSKYAGNIIKTQGLQLKVLNNVLRTLTVSSELNSQDYEDTILAYIIMNLSTRDESGIHVFNSMVNLNVLTKDIQGERQKNLVNLCLLVLGEARDACIPRNDYIYKLIRTIEDYEFNHI